MKQMELKHTNTYIFVSLQGCLIQFVTVEFSYWSTVTI